MLSGCSALDSLNEYMPVIGKRCYSWECMSDSGQQKNDAIVRAREQYNGGAGGASSDSQENTSGRKPIGSGSAVAPTTTEGSGKKSTLYYDTVTPDNYKNVTAPPGTAPSTNEIDQ